MSNTNTTTAPVRYDLLYIGQTIRRHSRFIALVAIAAAVCAVAASLVRKKKWEGVVQFFVASPYFTDRNNVFRPGDQGITTPYFGGDDDIDKIVGISKTEQYALNVIRKAGLSTYYKIDTSTAKKRTMLNELFLGNVKIKRSEYQLVELHYTAKDPENAARIANIALQELDRMYSSFHLGMRNKVATELATKLTANDSAINALTDSLAILRDRYGIYDLISPTRYNLINQSGTHGAGSGYGIEQIQNIEAMKDQLVTDRARHASILNEYTLTSKEEGGALFSVVSPAIPPTKPAGLHIIYVAIGALLTGALLATLWVLTVSFIRSATATSRT